MLRPSRYPCEGGGRGGRGAFTANRSSPKLRRRVAIAYLPAVLASCCITSSCTTAHCPRCNSRTCQLWLRACMWEWRNAQGVSPGKVWEALFQQRLMSVLAPMLSSSGTSFFWGFCTTAICIKCLANNPPPTHTLCSRQAPGYAPVSSRPRTKPPPHWLPTGPWLNPPPPTFPPHLLLLSGLSTTPLAFSRP